MRLGQNSFLNLELSALENEGAAQVISTPHLITANQQTALIEGQFRNTLSRKSFEWWDQRDIQKSSTFIEGNT